jgi:carbamoyltransferase
MKLLGLRINAHDSNFTLYDGEKLRYHKTERSKQEKHHALMGLFDWRGDVKQAFGVSVDDIDKICISMEETTINEFISDAQRASSDLVKKCTGFPVPCDVYQIDHHYAHSLSYVPYMEPDVSIIIDGIGDNEVPWSVFKKDTLVEAGDVWAHGSIGLLMNEFGKFAGISYGHEVDIAGKVMGLQSYGKFDKKYYDTLGFANIYNSKMLFNFNKWNDYIGDPLLGKQCMLDWINTVHIKAGEVLLSFFQKHCKPDDVIFYSGGVAQNVIWNTVLKKHFKNLVILPHSADDGISIGAVEWLRRKYDQPRIELTNFPFSQTDEAPSDEPTDDVIDFIAKALSQGKTVAWYQGNGEIGPRALGNRSILMDPRIVNGREKINKIKKREQYRPFGASILSEHREEYFDLEFDNPYMLYVGKAKTDKLDAITHVDGTCRVQTVEPNSGYFRKLLEKFHEYTGCPVLLNTSLNLGGKPIAGYKHNAEQLYYDSYLDYLVIGNKIYTEQYGKVHIPKYSF